MPLRRLPLRVRLVAGFVAAMLVVLTAAGAFVYWRVQTALDNRLDEDLASQAVDLQTAARATADPSVALDDLAGEGRSAQLLATDGAVLAAGADQTGGPPLLTPEQVRAATTAPLHTERGNLLSRRHLRIQALPVTATPDGRTVVAVAAVDLDQRDEALRELLAQLALANLAALAVASAVGYRLARAALLPVERYRAQAEQITAGATSVRLDVPAGPDDEISRLGHTLNTLLAAQEQAALRQQRFIDDASHELRTPLTVLATEIELALRRPRTASELETTLRRIADDTSHLVQLAEDLLTLGAQGSTAPQAHEMNTHQLLDAAARRARSQLPLGSARSVHIAAPTTFSSMPTRRCSAGPWEISPTTLCVTATARSPSPPPLSTQIPHPPSCSPSTMTDQECRLPSSRTPPSGSTAATPPAHAAVTASGSHSSTPSPTPTTGSSASAPTGLTTTNPPRTHDGPATGAPTRPPEPRSACCYPLAESTQFQSLATRSPTDDHSLSAPMSGLVERILQVSAVWVYLLVGLLVFLEAAVFVGFVLPGETAAVLGGVAASLGHDRGGDHRGRGHRCHHRATAWDTRSAGTTVPGYWTDRSLRGAVRARLRPGLSRPARRCSWPAPWRSCGR
ncbi:histidine kinase dimerization/phospho-acceptor domain-containing protein [Rhodococcus sp. ZPP]|uniref:histidine kinase dimerization/phospho-acceptor domain-containing protein n=1 Tax=Rhodococcus sp. ZPP TaxID=2749906 RepID=UPI001FCD1B9B|nr:histidine kinase dimerization/phospho-acceptor domain-containing protein [Rhodococcus sp. ZPP]